MQTAPPKPEKGFRIGFVAANVFVNEIEININDLHLGQAITVGELELPDDCEIHHEYREQEEEEVAVNPPEQVVVEVTHPVEEPEEEGIPEHLEPEVISEQKEEDGAEGH